MPRFAIYVARPKTLTNINQIISNTILSCQRVIKHSISRCFLEVGLYQYSFSVFHFIVGTGSLSGSWMSARRIWPKTFNSLSLSAAYTVLQPTSGTCSLNSRGNMVFFKECISFHAQPIWNARNNRSIRKAQTFGEANAIRCESSCG